MFCQNDDNIPLYVLVFWFVICIFIVFIFLYIGEVSNLHRKSTIPSDSEYPVLNTNTICIFITVCTSIAAAPFGLFALVFFVAAIETIKIKTNNYFFFIL